MRYSKLTQCGLCGAEYIDHGGADHLCTFKNESEHPQTTIDRLTEQVARLEEELAKAKREAECFVTSLWRQFYQEVSPNWGLCDSVAGVITQIDNMVAGIIEDKKQAEKELAEAKEKLKYQYGIEDEADEKYERCLANLDADEYMWTTTGMEQMPCGDWVDADAFRAIYRKVGELEAELSRYRGALEEIEQLGRDWEAVLIAREALEGK